MNEVQVEVFDLELVERGLDLFGDGTVVDGVVLGGDVELRQGFVDGIGDQTP